MSRMNINGCIGDLTPFPGCGQIVVSHNVFLPPEYRGQGHGGKAHKERLNVMHNLGYDYALATVISTNERERAILVSNGWRIIADFNSSRSGEFILIYGRRIEKKHDRSIVQPVGAEYYDHDDMRDSIDEASQRQQFQNVPCDVEYCHHDRWSTDCKRRVDSETAIHEEIQRVRQET